jgi:hypothetical protein
MKRIELLGGMSWESSAEYYRLINEATRTNTMHKVLHRRTQTFERGPRRSHRLPATSRKMATRP